MRSDFPDYLVIGAMKCGTSTVCAYLEDHPGAFMVPGLDPGYFSDDAVHARGPDWYAGLFADARPGQPRGEGSNGYAAGALYPQAPARIAAAIPEARLIYMVRHPIRRIVSAWIQNRVDQGDEVPPTLDRAVAERPDTFVDQSLYWRNLQRYRALFPDERIFVGFMEDMAADRTAFFAALTGFLGIEPFEPLRPHANPSAGKRVPSRAYSAVRGLPLFRQLRRAVPRGLQRAVKDRFLSDAADRTDFSPAARARLSDLLQPDAQALLRHCGKPADFWTF